MQKISQLDLSPNLVPTTIRIALLALTLGLANCNRATAEPDTILPTSQLTCTHTQSHGEMPFGQPWPFQFQVRGVNLPANMRVHVFQTTGGKETEVYTGTFPITATGIIDVKVPFDKFIQNAPAQFSVSLPTQMGSGIPCTFP